MTYEDALEAYRRAAAADTGSWSTTREREEAARRLADLLLARNAK